MEINKEKIIHFIVPQFKWWIPCWYAFLADIALLAISASVTNIVNISKMQEKSGTLEWVKSEVIRVDETCKWYRYEFKLQNDTTSYRQSFCLGKTLLFVMV